MLGKFDPPGTHEFFWRLTKEGSGYLPLMARLDLRWHSQLGSVWHGSPERRSLFIRCLTRAKYLRDEEDTAVQMVEEAAKRKTLTARQSLEYFYFVATNAALNNGVRGRAIRIASRLKAPYCEQEQVFRFIVAILERESRPGLRTLACICCPAVTSRQKLQLKGILEKEVDPQVHDAIRAVMNGEKPRKWQLPSSPQKITHRRTQFLRHFAFFAANSQVLPQGVGATRTASANVAARLRAETFHRS
jgi:hypothetical protein